MYALALRYVRCAPTAQDIAQDVFLVAYQKLRQLRSTDRFGAWLRTITVRRCKMWFRAQAGKVRENALAEDLMIGEVPGAADGAAHGDSILKIDALLKELPDGLRAAAVLCLAEGVSPSAAAEVLGLKPGTLRKRLHDARARLQRRIVERAERELQLDLLPKDFAERCVCRCGRATKRHDPGKEVTNMAEKKNEKKGCGCGCLGASKRQARPKNKTKGK